MHAFWAEVTGVLSGARHGGALLSRVPPASDALLQTERVHVPRSAVQKKEEERRLKEAERLRQLREKEQARPLRSLCMHDMHAGCACPYPGPYASTVHRFIPQKVAEHSFPE